MSLAARVGDHHTCPFVDPDGVPHVGGPIIPPCKTNVLIEGIPAARVTDRLICADGVEDVIVKGSKSVFIGDLPAARLLDQCAHGGFIDKACRTVDIGG